MIIIQFLQFMNDSSYAWNERLFPVLKKFRVREYGIENALKWMTAAENKNGIHANALVRVSGKVQVI